ncbi:hypothetical protein V7S43_013147 [Phytophthora oleae]|uniref:ORC1/DEAH AAA+ ATPase domain-containing protein n=1 Tax=Phytophthora oleae TaxID=2107226 RepID=A0ABD3F563_9STRA
MRTCHPKSESKLEVAYQGPVYSKGFFSVPVESIDTYQQLRTAFLTRSIAPLGLLYGPRQFGKTTIAHRLWTSLAEDPSVLAMYLSIIPLDVKTEKDFWLALSRTIDEETTSFEEFQDMIQRSGKRLWLAIDKMDAMFKNEELTSNFMQYLLSWQSSQSFLGFLELGAVTC